MANGAVVAFAISILLRLAGLNMARGNTLFLSPSTSFPLTYSGTLSYGEWQALQLFGLALKGTIFGCGNDILLGRRGDQSALSG